MASLSLGEVRDVSGSPSSLRPIWGNPGRFTSKGVNGALLLNWSLVGRDQPQACMAEREQCGWYLRTASLCGTVTSCYAGECVTAHCEAGDVEQIQDIWSPLILEVVN